MLHDFPSWHRYHFYGYINASYRNNRNRKQFLNILNREKILDNDIPTSILIYSEANLSSVKCRLYDGAGVNGRKKFFFSPPSFLQNSRKKNFKFFFSNIFPKTAEKKIKFFFLQRFSKNSRKKKLNFFSPPFFPKTAEFFLKIFCCLFLCKLSHFTTSKGALFI